MLAAIAAESIGWQPLGDGAYLHLGKPEEKEIVITVVGVPEAGMAGITIGDRPRFIWVLILARVQANSCGIHSQNYMPSS